MNCKRGILFLLILIIVELFFFRTETFAQMGGSGQESALSFSTLFADRTAYQKKFYLKGFIELEYQKYSLEYSNHGQNSHRETTLFSQLYKLGVNGYIYNPKLALFSANIAYKKEKSKNKELSGNESDSKNINYDLSVIFLPRRPINLNVYALKNNTKTDGLGFADYDYSIFSYGARLVSTYKKLPMIILQYDHTEYTTERTRGTRITEDSDFYFDEFPPEEGGLVIFREKVKDKRKVDRFDLNVRGLFKPINTRYSLSANYTEFSGPLRSYDSQSLRTNTYTALKNQNVISTFFQYSNIDISKLMSFGTSLSLSPIGRIYHGYNFEYLTSETEDEKTSAYTFGGIWRYRLSNRINGRAIFRYRFGESDGVDENNYNFNINLNYGRPVKGYDFTSKYYAAIGREQKIGQFNYMVHGISAGLSTKKFKWGKIYLNYDFTYRILEYKPEKAGIKSTDSTEIENRLRMGINGRGPGRARWEMSFEARFLDASGGNEDPWISVWYGERGSGQKLRHYTMEGSLSYPLGIRGTMTLRSSYTTGTTDSEPITKYYYEGRITYRIFTRLNLETLWREELWNAGWWNSSVSVERRTFDTKIRTYELRANYYWRKMHLSLEYTSTKQDEGPSSTEANIMYFKINRRF
ncbi:MAG: hypothetical protein WA126_15725 [Thermodesulfovibrionales bacterium]